MGKAFDPGNTVTGGDCQALPDVEVGAAVLPLWMRAVLREVSGTIQGGVVEAMSVRVTGGERKPVRNPLGQGRLQAVVIGTGIVRNLVDKVQVWERGGGSGTKRIAVRITRCDKRGNSLVKVAKTGQSFAVSADIANLQREVVGEGVLDT